MKKHKVKASIFLGLLALLVSCNDIVTYNNGYDDGMASYGPPVISYISPVGDLDENITEGSFNQMVVIHGENLSQIESILFNDQTVDLKNIYALSKKITLPIPGTVPDNVTNMITVTTKKGTATYPFKIAFPDLVINGISHEFANAGEIIDIRGENLKLYGLSPETADIKMNGAAVTVVDCDESKLSFIIPDNVTDNASLTISSDRIQQIIGETIELTYRDTGLRFIDWGPSYLTHSAITPAYRTDGSAEGDPLPLAPGTNFSRVRGQLATNSWNFIANSYTFTLSSSNPEAKDILDNLREYSLKYEILIPEDIPVTVTSHRIVIALNSLRNVEKEWIMAASGTPYETKGRWATISMDGADYYQSDGASFLKDGSNVVSIAYINSGLGTSPDVSFTNFRFAKKIVVRKQQK